MFLPDNIDFEKPDKYILFIRITPSAFSFLIHEKRAGGDYCFRETFFEKELDILGEVQRIIFEYNFLTLPFSQTNVVVVSKNYELIPSYLLEKNKAKTLFNFTHHQKANKVLYSEATIQDNLVLFSIQEDLYTFLMRSLFNPQFYHHTNFILKHIEEYQSIIKDRPSLFLYFHDQFTDIFLYDKSFNIISNNTLEDETDINTLYQILNVWDKAELDQVKDSIYIIDSERNQRKLCIKLLREYINHIKSDKILTSVFFKINEETDPNIPVDLLIKI